MSETIELLKNFGFPVVVALILLYDKIKSNGQLKKAVENNTEILNHIHNDIRWLKNGKT